MVTSTTQVCPQHVSGICSKYPHGMLVTYTRHPDLKVLPKDRLGIAIGMHAVCSLTPPPTDTVINALEIIPA